ncbi:hypothetical protein LTR27_010321 [Elasticomyces elasticus]|nr:hypothetical protein LTR27_010321 [Elasticomyces elasticus]
MAPRARPSAKAPRMMQRAIKEEDKSKTPEAVPQRYQVNITSAATTLYEHHTANFRRMQYENLMIYRKDTVYQLSTLDSHDMRHRLDASSPRLPLPAAGRINIFLPVHRRYIQVLLALSTHRLPNELVLRILAAKAKSTLSELNLENKDTIYKTAENLLGREAPNELVHLMEKTLLDIIPLRVTDVTYARHDPTATTKASFPAFISTSSLLGNIRSLVLNIDVAGSGQYPAQLFRLASSMASLKEQVPLLHVFYIVVHIKIPLSYSHCRPMRERLQEKCSAGYTGPITYGAALERLVAAVQGLRVGRRQVLAFGSKTVCGLEETRFTRPALSELEFVDVDMRSAGELVKLAAQGLDGVGGNDSDSLEQAAMLMALGAPPVAAATRLSSEGHTETRTGHDLHDSQYQVSINSDKTTVYEHRMADFRRFECRNQHWYNQYVLHDLSTLHTHDSRYRMDAGASRYTPRDSSLGAMHQESLDAHRRYVQVMLALSTDRLPKELVQRVLAAKALSALSSGLAFSNEDTIVQTAECLLGREAPDELVDLMESTILEVAPIRLDEVTFTRQNTTTTFANLPTFIPTYLLRSIRTLVLAVDVAPIIAGQYPAQLFRLTASMASLKERLPQLHVLRIAVQFTWQEGRLMRDDLEVKCTAGYTGSITYRAAVERLVTATQKVRVGRRQELELSWNRVEGIKRDGRKLVLPTFDRADIDSRSAAEIVENARVKAEAEGNMSALG